jgi:hypothetical protein
LKTMKMIAMIEQILKMTELNLDNV